MKDDRCVVCGNHTTTRDGWHFAHDLNFCSDRCVAKYIDAMQRSKLPAMMFCWDCGAEGTEEDFEHFAGCKGKAKAK
jgi:hypothetical protein